MNWKINLNKNLKLLNFDFRQFSLKDTENIFDTPNAVAMQTIVFFLLSKIDSFKHDELQKLWILATEAKSKRGVMKELYTWCHSVIRATFGDFAFDSNVFNNPYGKKVYETLCRLTIGLMKQIGENELATVRQPIINGQIRKLGLSSKVLLLSLREDFVRETEQYLCNISRLQYRRQLLQSKIEVRRHQIQRKEQEIEYKKQQLLLEEQELIGVTNENNDGVKCLENVESSLFRNIDKFEVEMKEVMLKVDMLSAICEDIKVYYEMRNRSTKISLPEVDGQILKLPCEFYRGDGRLMVDKLIDKIVEEGQQQQQSEEPLKAVSLSRELSRVSGALATELGRAEDLLCYTTSAIDHIEGLHSTVLLRLQSDNSCSLMEPSRLAEFGRAPSISQLLSTCVSVEDTELCKSDIEHCGDDSISDSDSSVTNDDSRSLSVFTGSPASCSLYRQSCDVVSNNDGCLSDNNSHNSDTIDPRYLIASPRVTSRVTTALLHSPSPLHYRHHDEQLDDYNNEEGEKEKSTTHIEDEDTAELIKDGNIHTAKTDHDEGNFFDKSNDSFLEKINNLSFSSDTI